MRIALKYSRVASSRELMSLSRVVRSCSSLFLQTDGILPVGCVRGSGESFCEHLQRGSQQKYGREISSPRTGDAFYLRGHAGQVSAINRRPIPSISISRSYPSSFPPLIPDPRRHVVEIRVENRSTSYRAKRGDSS